MVDIYRRLGDACYLFLQSRQLLYPEDKRSTFLQQIFSESENESQRKSVKQFNTVTPSQIQ